MQEARQAGPPFPGAHTRGHSENPFLPSIHQEKSVLPEETPGVGSTDVESEACWHHLSLVAPSKPVNLSFPICKAGWRWVSALTTPRVAAERKHSAKSSPDRRGVAAPPSSLLPGGVSAEAAPPCRALSWPEHTHPADRQTLFWRKSSDEKQKTGSRWNIWLLVTTHCGRKKTFSINKSVRDTGLRAGGVTMGCIHGLGPCAALASPPGLPGRNDHLHFGDGETELQEVR